ncbi:transcription initiation factor TFIID/TFIIF subunit [Entomortierella parvispora]|uniref:Transcription initiation factor TFIID/TFIIF subunit n=1 Tax=Entomortierella parvispora TaxID=205924 RepID=A0A9P3H3I9_9FUNG|nr:transcription initiation factor TFIID/TFIIF subunit [Entomortierella parvispora]
MPQKHITKEIKVLTNQRTVKGQKQNGFPMRRWKISLVGVDANGEEEPLPYIEYVEYVLHHTFEEPVRKVTEYPFELQERGWGEFDMKIMLYFADKSPVPFVLDHDLNFQMQHYEVSHTLTFKADLKPSFIKLLNPPVETISERSSPLSGNDDIDGKAHKRRRDTIGKENSKRIKEDDSSDDDDSSISESVDEWESKVNVHVLADKFQQLNTEDLLELVSMVKANQTSDMYILEDGEAGEFHIDLRTLGDDLLNRLWQFCDKRLDG